MQRARATAVPTVTATVAAIHQVTVKPMLTNARLRAWLDGPVEKPTDPTIPPPAHTPVATVFSMSASGSSATNRVSSRHDGFGRLIGGWVAAISLILASGGALCGEVGSGPPEDYDPAKLVISALSHEDDAGLFILLRDQAGKWQKDVGVGDAVISFAKVFLDRRMRCEFLYLDERHWFGACTVYPWQGDSVRDILMKNSQYRQTIKLDQYFISASRESCEPILVRRQVGYADLSRHWVSPRLNWAVAQEIALWSPSARRAVRNALKISPSRSHVHQMLARLHGLSDGWRSTVFDSDALEALGKEETRLEEIPNEIRLYLSGEQLRGLDEFFDDQVLAIP